MSFIEILKVIFLGIVEGITEWLPISSTGHMILLDEFIKLNVTNEFKEMFFVVIQLGAIMAVIILYFNKLNPFSMKKTRSQREDTMKIWYKVIIGILPATIVGLLLDDWLSEKFYNYKTVAITLIFYGILFIIVENYNKGKSAKIRTFRNLPYSTAFFIGIFQLLSLIPGTSRSGSTILGGIILGTSRYIATEFSFFLSIPIMFGASILKLFKFGITFSTLEIIILLIGIVVSFLVSLFSIKFLLKYIKNNSFKVFGYYRIFLGILVICYFVIFAN